VRFWDSSAIIPLVIDEPTSARVSSWFREDDRMTVWTLTSVEIVSALERQVREGTLEAHQALAAEDLALAIMEACDEIIAVDAAKALARRVLRTHPLRAADALQLAAALLWVDGNPEGSLLHTFDRRLGLAALREGFRVLPDPAML
jgi:predicted nucleic acid-binding protein